jgi:hypothetical protein
LVERKQTHISLMNNSNGYATLKLCGVSFCSL